MTRWRVCIGTLDGASGEQFEIDLPADSTNETIQAAALALRPGTYRHLLEANLLEDPA